MYVLVCMGEKLSIFGRSVFGRTETEGGERAIVAVTVEYSVVAKLDRQTGNIDNAKCHRSLYSRTHDTSVGQEVSNNQIQMHTHTHTHSETVF